MKFASFLDIPAVRVRMLVARRRSLAIVSLVLLVTYLVVPSPQLGMVATLAGVAAALGWWAKPSTGQIEALLVFDLVAALAVWYLLAPAAAIAFLVILVVVVGNMLLPWGSALRLTVAAVVLELARIPIYLTNGFGMPLYHGHIELSTGDFLIGVGVRTVVIVWGTALARTIMATINEAVRSTETSERRFGAAFADAPIGMGLLDHMGRVISLNATFVSLTSIDDYRVGETGFAELFSSQDRNVVMRSVRWAAANPYRRMDIECETHGSEDARRLVALSLVGVEDVAPPGGGF